MRSAKEIRHPDVQFQPERVATRGIFLFAGALATLLIFVHLILWWQFRRFEEREALLKPVPSALEQRERPTLPPSPRLEVLPRGNLQKMREQENEILNSYGWVDRKAGIVRIPIDRAMDVAVGKLNRRKSGR